MPDALPDLDTLERLALAVDDLPVWPPLHEDGLWYLYFGEYADEGEADFEVRVEGTQAEDFARFAFAATPENVLALIREVRRLRREYERQMGDLRRATDHTAELREKLEMLE